MPSIKLLIITTLFTLIYAHPALSQNETIDTPIYLYHWVHSSILQRIAQLGIAESRSRMAYDTPSGIAPFFKPVDVIGGDVWVGQNSNGRTSALVASFPELNGRMGVYTTTNPATGSLGVSSERYGDILVRFKIDPKKVRRADLVPSSEFSNQTDELTPQQRNANLLFHNAAMKEWIILDPSIIESFTADPELLRADLEPLLEKLKRPKTHPNFKFADSEIHYNSNFNDIPADPKAYFQKVSGNVRNYAIYAISKFLKYGRSLMPHQFIGETDQNIPLPTSTQIKSLTAQRIREEAAISEREIRIGLFPVVTSDTPLRPDIYEQIYKGLSVAFVDRLKQEIKKQKKTAPFASMTDTKDSFVREVTTAVFTPIASIGPYRNRFYGRFSVLGLADSDRVGPFEQFTPEEIIKLQHLYRAAQNPKTTARQLIQLITEFYQIESLVNERLSAVHTKYKTENFLVSEKPTPSSCKHLFY